MAAVGSEDIDKDNSVSMRITLFGIRKTFPKVRQLDTGTLEKFMQENDHKNLILLVSNNAFKMSCPSRPSTATF